MRRANVLRLLSVAAIAVLAAAWFVAFGPAPLGGPVTYVWISGESMLPMFENGDLALVRRDAASEVSDVVAYRVPRGEPGAGFIVIHRIVGGSAATGFVMQGDNNQRPDIWRPHDRDILGRLWFSIPNGVLLPLRRPLFGASVCAGLAVFLLLLGGGRRSDAVPTRDAALARTTAVAGSVIGSGAWSRPLHKPSRWMRWRSRTRGANDG